jgi:hypothetical protein
LVVEADGSQNDLKIYSHFFVEEGACPAPEQNDWCGAMLLELSNV